MQGTQRSIFETVLLYLESNNANFDYIGKESIEKLITVAESEEPYKGIMMQEAKVALDLIQKDVSTQQKIEREKIEREKNVKHKKEINQQALKAFVDNGFSEDDAKKIITLIAKKSIPFITINY